VRIALEAATRAILGSAQFDVLVVLFSAVSPLASALTVHNTPKSSQTFRFRLISPTSCSTYEMLCRLSTEIRRNMRG
jgi:hypothetical protein